MKKLNAKCKLLICAALLVIISAAWLIINGSTFTLDVPVYLLPSGAEQPQIVIEPYEGQDIVRCTGTSLENDVLRITLTSVQQGRTFISVGAGEQSGMLIPVYVHPFGIISVNQFLGDVNGGLIIPIALTVFLAYAMVLLICSYRRSMKESLYQYRNIAYLGLMIFASFALVYQFVSIFSYRGLYDLIDGVLNLFGTFSILTLPAALIVSVLVIISNVVLVRREGKTIRNLLGLILGGLLCFAAIFPSILEYVLYHTNWVDVHNQNGLATYVHLFSEAAVYIGVVYLECVLLATIILSVRAARRTPRFDKDYMLILGCQIRKDGTLTKLLQSRVDKALAFDRLQQQRTGKSLIFVPSGGQGSDEVMAEAQAIRRYLIEQGIEENRILAEDRSTSTQENIRFSAELIRRQKEDAVIAFSTTNYHVFRAGALAHRLKIPMEGVGAPTKAYFWINAFIREFVATMVSERKKHIAVLCFILLLALVLVYLSYVANAL